MQRGLTVDEKATHICLPFGVYVLADGGVCTAG